MKRWADLAGLALVLAGFAFFAYGTALNLPFVGDDYVFLDKTRDARFVDLWSFTNTDFGWYRPWSRELHFWVLQHVAGLNELAFRSLGVVLWITVLCLYAVLVRRLASMRVAALATLGVAGLALWGTPLLWISGSQDLWMLCFSLIALLVYSAGRPGWTVIPFGLALLSKETAAVVPALLVAYAILVEHRRLADALRRTAHLWLLLAAWIAVHPTLHARLTSHAPTLETKLRPSVPGIVVKTLLSMLNVDVWPNPRELSSARVIRMTLALVVLIGGVMLFVYR